LVWKGTTSFSPENPLLGGERRLQPSGVGVPALKNPPLHPSSGGEFSSFGLPPGGMDGSPENLLLQGGIILICGGDPPDHEQLLITIILGLHSIGSVERQKISGHAVEFLPR
jgi:hypothetical protein